VGIAIGSGTMSPPRPATIVLMGEPSSRWPLLVRLSRETVRSIRQNIIVFRLRRQPRRHHPSPAGLWPLLAPTAYWYEQAPLVGVLYHQLGSRSCC